MNREHLFRGKRKDNKEWVEGYFVKDPKNQYRIYWQPFPEASSNTYHFIIPETVGQFTGFHASKYKRKLNTKIFEDDIFRAYDADDNDVYYVVMWIEQRGAFYMVPIEHYEIIKDNDISDVEEFEWLFEEALLYDFSFYITLTKVGNVHDNPELLKK